MNDENKAEFARLTDARQHEWLMSCLSLMSHRSRREFFNLALTKYCRVCGEDRGKCGHVQLVIDPDALEMRFRL